MGGATGTRGHVLTLWSVGACLRWHGRLALAAGFCGGEDSLMNCHPEGERVSHLVVATVIALVIVRVVRRPAG